MADMNFSYHPDVGGVYGQFGFTMGGFLTESVGYNSENRRICNGRDRLLWSCNRFRFGGRRTDGIAFSAN